MTNVGREHGARIDWASGTVVAGPARKSRARQTPSKSAHAPLGTQSRPVDAKRPDVVCRTCGKPVKITHHSSANPQCGSCRRDRCYRLTQDIRRLRGEGLPHLAIAERLGCAESTVYRYAEEAQVKFPRRQPDGTHRCTGCKLTLPESAFSGINARCKACHNRHRRKAGGRGAYAQLVHPPDQKQCNRCLVAKDFSEFYQCKTLRFGRANACKECCRKRACSEMALERKLDERLRRLYGIDIAQYRSMRRNQNDRCANPGCRQPFTDSGRRRYHVDHRHATGYVRGLLCLTCNVALGSFGDDIARIVGAARYLLDARKREAAGILTAGVVATSEES